MPRDFERVEVRSIDELRQWLTEHHNQSESIWLVTWKKRHPYYLAYGDVVDEALCFGWIDSLPRKLDDERTMHLLSPRKRGSAWSAVNRTKAARLIADARMTAAGLAKIEQAKSDGSWDRLAQVDAIEPPEDLSAAFDKAPRAARDNWNAFSRSSRRGILEWIVLAKRADTRRRRIAETVELAAKGLKANHPARGAAREA